MALTMEPGGALTIGLPGVTAVRIDFASRIIAVDGISAPAANPGPDWTVLDLRDGIYSDFHRLRPAEECFDPGRCANTGQHVTVQPDKD